MMNNWIKVQCPKCKGEGKFRGQQIKEGGKLPNYKHNKSGKCFTCNGEKVLYLTEDGKYVRVENNRILKYTPQGRYIGILDTVESYNNRMESMDYSYIYEEKTYTLDDFFVIEDKYKEAVKLLADGTHPSDNEVINRVLDCFQTESVLLDEFKIGYRSIRFLSKYLLNIASTISQVNHALITSKKLNNDIIKELEMIRNCASTRQTMAFNTMQELLNS